MSVEGYEYHKKIHTDPTFGSAIDMGLPDPLQFLVTGLTDDTEYDFQIRSYDDAGNRSDWSDTATETTDVIPFDAASLFTKFYFEADQQALADTDPFVTLHDQSAAAHNGTQATSGSRATNQTNEVNGLPVARFDGSDDFYQTVSALSAGAGFTLAFVVKGTGMLGGGFPGGGGVGAGNYYAWLTTSTSFNGYFGDTSVSGVTLDDTTADFSLIVIRSNHATYRVYQNGVSKGTGSDVSVWALDLIGKYASGSNFTGDMALIGYEDSFISDPDLADFTTYVMDKYGL